MFKTNLKIAIRNLMKNKLYSFINISGLTVGMASAMLIFLWIENELSHDRFHANIDRTYLMNKRDKGNAGISVSNYTPRPLGPAIKKDYPEVEEVVRVNNSGANFLISNNDKHFSIHGIFADPGFLKVFSFPLLQGDAEKSLNSVQNILLTEQLAKKLFGNENALGKSVRIDSTDYATVTGVLKDLPNNTSFQFEYVLPWSYATRLRLDDDNWGNNSIQTFVMLKQGASLAAFNNKVSNIVMEHDKNSIIDQHVFAQPFGDSWLYSRVENGNYVGGRIELVRLFIIIAVFILLIACINFTNLSTARSEKRAKEVGIRKVVGAQKRSLIMQFISESILLAFVAGIIAVLLAQLCLPAFANVIGKQLSIDFGNAKYIGYALLFVLFTGLMAGLYPAFYLSSFKPVKVLKGTFRSVNALVTPRKVLVVLQFTFAIALIICTIIVKNQILYAQNRDAGYSRNNLAFVIMFGDMEKNYQLIKQEMLRSGAATAVSQTSSPMTESWNTQIGFSWDGSVAGDDQSAFKLFSADNDFTKAMGTRFLQGRGIDVKTYLTDSFAVVLNEAAVRAMHFKEPIGKAINIANFRLHVVGVLKDFILENPYSPVFPMIIAGPVVNYNVINFRVNPKPSFAANLQKAEQIFKQYNPQYPFNCRFYDKEYELKFAEEKRAGTLAGLFAVLTVFISCLGLFGLATYMAENRVKEIGIRKVLGASVGSIAGLLSKEFLQLVVISFVIATPVTWILMNKWLMHYQYRTSIHWWVFALAGISSGIIAIATVSFQSIKAALANPAKSLRTE
ncbi:MAG: ABC transporter permease [Agriterribacter sp.]